MLVTTNQTFATEGTAPLNELLYKRL